MYCISTLVFPVISESPYILMPFELATNIGRMFCGFVKGEEFIYKNSLAFILSASIASVEVTPKEFVVSFLYTTVPNLYRSGGNVKYEPTLPGIADVSNIFIF